MTYSLNIKSDLKVRLRNRVQIAKKSLGKINFKTELTNDLLNFNVSLFQKKSLHIKEKFIDP